jgi:hypothetical protein
MVSMLSSVLFLVMNARSYPEALLRSMRYF